MNEQQNAVKQFDWLDEIIKEAFDRATQNLTAEQADVLATHFGVK